MLIISIDLARNLQAGFEQYTILSRPIYLQVSINRTSHIFADQLIHPLSHFPSPYTERNVSPRPVQLRGVQILSFSGSPPTNVQVQAKQSRSSATCEAQSKPLAPVSASGDVLSATPAGCCSAHLHQWKGSSRPWMDADAALPKHLSC